VSFNENSAMIELNSREWAVLVWLAIVIVILLRKRTLRSSLVSLVGALLQWKLQASIVAAIAWSAGCVWLLSRLGLWEWDDLKTTIIWGITFMLVTMFDVATSNDGAKALRSLAGQAVTVTVIVGFIAEFYTLPFWAELLLLPALVVLGGMVALAESRAEYSRMAAPLLAVQAVVGIGLLAFSTYQIALHWTDFATAGTVHEFTVPILLSFMYLPFLYGLLVWMAYENAAVRLQFTIPDERLRRAAYFRGMLAFGANIALFQRYLRALNAADSLDRQRIKEAIDEVRRIRRREKRPPTVDWSQGWSPYDAQGYLDEHGLRTNDYHRSPTDWWAESPAVEIGGDILKDRLTYRISGTETAATKLTLELNANVPGEPEQADEQFRHMAKLLVAQALGDETAKRYANESAGQEEGSILAGRFRVGWQHDSWGDAQRGGYYRKISVIHPAHVDHLPGLEDG
jgi:hypothetical protein